MQQLIALTPPRKLSLTKANLSPLSMGPQTPKKLPALPPSKSLMSPSPMLPPPPFERRNSYSTDTSSRNSVDFSDAGSNYTELSEKEEEFLRAVSHNNSSEVLRLLQRENVDIHVKNGFSRDAMQIAARNGSIPMLELLSQNGGSLESRGPKGDTLHQLAASNGHLKVGKWLLANGLTDAPDLMGNTAVHVAARRCETEILRFLYLSMGCDFRLRNSDGQTPYDCIPRIGDDFDNVRKCRELVKSIVAEADAQESEEKMAVVRRRASLSPLPTLFNTSPVKRF